MYKLVTGAVVAAVTVVQNSTGGCVCNLSCRGEDVYLIYCFECLTNRNSAGRGSASDSLMDPDWKCIGMRNPG